MVYVPVIKYYTFVVGKVEKEIIEQLSLSSMYNLYYVGMASRKYQKHIPNHKISSVHFSSSLFNWRRSDSTRVSLIADSFLGPLSEKVLSSH